MLRSQIATLGPSFDKRPAGARAVGPDESYPLPLRLLIFVGAKHFALHLTTRPLRVPISIGRARQLLAVRSACDLSVVKTKAEFGVYLAGVVVMKSSEGHTVVQKDAAICHIQSSHGNTIFIREAFPE